MYGHRSDCWVLMGWWQRSNRILLESGSHDGCVIMNMNLVYQASELSFRHQTYFGMICRPKYMIQFPHHVDIFSEFRVCIYIFLLNIEIKHIVRIHSEISQELSYSSIMTGDDGECQGILVMACPVLLIIFWAQSQYKDRLIYVWRFPC